MARINIFFLYTSLFLTTLSFLFLIFYSRELQILYFLVQEIASFLFLLVVLLKLPLALLLIRLILKIGLVPFHFWLIKFLTDLKWLEIVLFFTLIKCIPLWIIVHITTIKFFIFFVLNSVIRTCLILTTYLIKPLFIFSSNTHTIWIILATTQHLVLGLFYFLLYRIILFLLLNSFKEHNIKNKRFSIILFSVFIGLPPFPIFILKWVVLFSVLRYSTILSFLLLWTILLSIFSYFRVIIFLKSKNAFLGSTLKITSLISPFFLILPIIFF